MAFAHGKDSWLVIDGTDISSYTDQTSLNRVKDLFETSTFGTDDKTFIDGLREFGLPIGGKWDPTLDGVIAGTDDGSGVAFQFAPAGSATMGYAGTALIENYNIDSPVGGGVTWTASFKPSGAVARGTQS